MLCFYLVSIFCVYLQAGQNVKSVQKTVERLEEAAVYYHGPERVQLLKRWLVLLKEIDEMPATLSEDNEKTPEQTIEVDKANEKLKKPSMVNKTFAFYAWFIWFNLAEFLLLDSLINLIFGVLNYSSSGSV